MSDILNHLPALQIFFPLFFGFVIALARNNHFASIMLKFVASISFLISAMIYFKFLSNGSVSYNFGGFSDYYGIVFKIDQLNLPIILLSSFLLFTASLLILTTKDGLEYSAYALILICYSAIFGILMTGDLFNLYVFLELYSIASAALFALGRDREQYSGAFYYLIINTIAATFILLAIGFLLAAGGNLNMEYIKLSIAGGYGSKIIMAGCVLFAMGAICKAAIFPAHFWAISVYNNANPRIFLLFGALASNVGFYILIRFAYFVVDYQKFFLTYNIQILLQIIGIMSVLYGAFMAWVAKDLRKIVIFSGISSVGYLAILFSVPETDALQYACIYNLTDAILKIILIVVATERERLGSMGNMREASKTLMFLTIIAIISAAGMPISMGFFNKIHFLRIVLYSTHYMVFALSLVASVLAIFYYYRIIQQLLFEREDGERLHVSGKTNIFIAIFTFIGYFLLIYNGSLLDFYARFFDGF
jgi:multicomponent Na+:H+ antiporter subunit D